MNLRRLAAASLGVWAIAAAGSLAPSAQQPEFTNNFKYNSGQAVQPIFEGWAWAPDGSINMHFGYLNRNYVERPRIPIGADNRIEPGGPDRGQPTYFYNRTHRNLFTVNVPKTFGKTDEIVWTLTVNGKTARAVGWLQPEWEIDPVGGASGGGNTSDERKLNKSPVIDIAPVSTVKLPGTAVLTALVVDDGLPKPRPRSKPPVGQETPPTLQGGVEDVPVNVPQIVSTETPPGATARPGDRRPDGLSVRWIVWRGPANVTFDPAYAAGADGKAVTTATFTEPGEYVLRAAAFDGANTTYSQVNINVTR